MSSSSRAAGRWRTAVVGLALVASPLLTACGDGQQPTDDAPVSTQPSTGDGETDEDETDEDEQDENGQDENEQDEG